MVQNAVHTLEFPTGDDCPVHGDLYLPPGGPTRAIVILSHGFKGYRSWGFFPYLARALRDAGLLALSIDFSHNGRSTGGERRIPAGDATTPHGPAPVTEYPRRDLFARNTIRREVDDLSVVIRGIGGGALADYMSSPPCIGLYGHSRGGVVTIINALEHPSVRAICTWATPGDPDTFTEEQKQKWRREGAYNFALAEDGIPLSVSVSYLDDLEGSHADYQVARLAGSLRVPHLVVHGAADVVVPGKSAHQLPEATSALDDQQLLILKTGHTFGVSYPFSSTNRTPDALAEAVTETVNWFKDRLEGRGSA